MPAIYRTLSGKYVWEGDPNAWFLAYPDSDEAPPEVIPEGPKPRRKRTKKETD
jgi:hypothetical protein